VTAAQAEVAPAEYEEVRRLVRETVERSIPAGSTVAVISKGDPELIRFDGREGWHFPRTATGQYAGHHPHDAAAAIGHLEDVRSGGAQYLVVPSTYLWWFDYYADLEQHLQAHHRLFAGDRASCLVYSLIDGGGAALGDRNGDSRADQLRDFLAALLPQDARFAVLIGEDDEPMALGQSATWQLARWPSGVHRNASAIDAELASLAAGATGEVEYVVVPCSGWSRHRGDGPLLERVKRRWRLVARQERLGFVFAVRIGNRRLG
jgi:hypothetical protein